MMNRIDTKKCIAEILKETQGSHEFEKVAKQIMRAIGWSALNRIRQGLADVLDGFLDSKKERQSNVS
jgi:hypothetical protein